MQRHKTTDQKTPLLRDGRQNTITTRGLISKSTTAKLQRRLRVDPAAQEWNARAANLIWRVPKSSKKQRKVPNTASYSSPLPETICCATWHWPQPQDPVPSTTSWSQIIRPPGLVSQTELSLCLSTREWGNEPSNAGPDDHTLSQGKTYSTRSTIN